MLMKLLLTPRPSENCAGGLPVAARAVHCPRPLRVAPHTPLVVFQNTSKHTCGLHAKPEGQRLTSRRRQGELSPFPEA